MRYNVKPCQAPSENKYLDGVKPFHIVSPTMNKKHTAALSKWRKRREDMKALLASGETMADIGRKYKITRQRVRQIVT